MKTVRLMLWALVVLALAGAALLFLRQPASQPRPEPSVQAAFGGPFTLVDSGGRSFSSSQLAGKPYAIFFGFTHCPDVCPTTLARLVKLRGQLGGGDQALTILFVTVDPQRDRPEAVRRYLSLFDEPIVGLTGSPAQIERVKRQFGIFSQNVPDGAGGYGVDHTSSVLLFDRSGKFVATISPEENDEVALQKLRRTVA